MASFVFKMPDIGEGIVETEVVEWHIAPGDEVAEDTPLADVMTDKATVEITAPVAGRIIRIGCEAGEKMVIGADFVEFDTAADTAGADVSPATEPEPVADTSPTTPPKTQPAKETAAKATVVPADKDFDTPSLPPAKPKIRVVSDGDATVPAVKSGTTTDTDTDSKTAEPPTTTVKVDTAASAMTPEEPAASQQPVETVSTDTREIVPASPAVRRLASDLGLDLADIAGSGPAGRVTKDDIRRLIKPSAGSGTMNPGDSSSAAISNDASVVSRAAMQASSGSPPSGVGAISREPGAIAEVPVKGLRRLIAQRMQESKREIPHFSYVEEVRVDKLEDLRVQLNADREASMPKISLLHLLMLGVSRVVKGWPQCNANFDDEAETLNQYERVHLGVATMTSNGLMVPVVANACQLGLWEIAGEVNRLAEAARNSSLSREELTGGTLTVTSLGALAGIATTPVINRPETSIIGPNKMMKRVEMQNGVATEIRVMNISSSFDHRVVDGYDAASFIQELKKRLETPALLFLD